MATGKSPQSLSVSYSVRGVTNKFLELERSVCVGLSWTMRSDKKDGARLFKHLKVISKIL